MKMKTKIFSVIFICFFMLPFIGLQAETLKFTPGEKARFHVVETYDVDIQSMLDSDWNSKVEAVIDITVLTPTSVEILIRELQLDIENNRPQYPKSFHYHSEKIEDWEEGKAFSALVKLPFIINLDSDFTITGSEDKDHSGSIELFDTARNLLVHDLDFDDLDLFCISKEGIANFLTQVFHLQGKELKKHGSYPESFISKASNLKTTYEIYKLGSNGIKAEFDYQVKPNKHCKQILSGSAQWDSKNPLIQKRYIKHEVKCKKNHEKYNHIYQLSWASKPLKN